MNTASPAFGSGDAARFLVLWFRVKLGCVHKIGGQLTQSVETVEKVGESTIKQRGFIS